MTAAAAVRSEELPILQDLRRAVEGALEGKQDAVELALVALLARGHLLIEDVPGVGKTTLARALARAVGGDLRRVQFTSDLLPSDVLGVSVYDQRSGEFVLRQGPVFANVLLADEINRASPRTQSALLEAMNEGQVSLDGQTILLPDPFLVIATQNPQDFAGTFPLPESQLDRFLLRIRIGYAPPQVEMRLILEGHNDAVQDVPVVLDPARLVGLQRDVDRVVLDGALGNYLQALVLATRSAPTLSLGASTRGAISLAKAARARALLRGRTFCIADDIHDLALPVLSHRVRLASHADGFAPTRDEAEAAVREIVGRVPVPISRSTAPKASSLWRRLRRRLRAPRKLKFTRDGKFFVGITLGVGFAALNTANNLLYLLLGMLLALIVVSGVMSELSLRDLTVVRRLPLRAQVGRAHLVEIEVFNHKKRVPSYAIEVEDLRAGQPADKRCFFLKISPKSAQVAAYRRTPVRRGRDVHVGFRIATRFPFGLFEKSREVPAEGELIIYPAVDDVQLPPAGAGRAPGTDAIHGRGRGEDFLGLRILRDGEDPRDVHWRKSASLQQLVARERAREARPDVNLMLDNVRPAGAGEEWDLAFERRIRDVASRAVAYIKRGDSVTVRSTGGAVARGDRTTGADALLRFLALLETLPAATTAPAKEVA